MEEKELEIITAPNFYKKVDKPSVVETFQFINDNKINLKSSTKYSVLIDNELFPPKDFLRIMARIKGFHIEESGFNGGQANKPFENLDFQIISNDDLPFFNGSVLYPQIRKYQNAIDNTDWLKVNEIYKFKFVQWIEENIDFKTDSNEDIKQKIYESQQIAYSPETSTKGVNFIQTIVRYQDEYLTIDDVVKLKQIVNNEIPENKENLTLSFSSFPKTSAFLSFISPDRFIAYDGESIPSYEFLSKNNADYKTPPKRDYKAFTFYQLFYQNIKKVLKESHLDISVFKELLGVETVTELQWNFIAQDFLLFITRKIMNNTYTKIDITGHRLYKISMGVFLKSQEFKHIDPIEAFENKNLIVMHENTANNQGYEFKENLHIGDFIYLTYSQRRLSFIGKIKSEAREVGEVTDTELPEGWVCREVEIISEPIVDNTYDLDSRKDYMPSGNSTFKEVKDIHYANQHLFNKYYNVEIVDNNAQQKIIELIEEEKVKISHPLNLILYGAPGTGKTYLTKKLAVEIIEGVEYSNSDRETIVEKYKNYVESNNIYFTTFHQSLSYEDFIEGIKPKFTESGTEIEYEIRDGIFKLVCKEASQQNKVNNFDDTYNQFAEEISEMGILELRSLAQQKPFDVKINSNKNCIAIPHTETATNMVITKKMIEEYIVNNNTEDWKTYTSAIGEYIKQNYKISVSTNIEKKRNYVLIIDEINRGNVSAIFGELITLLEKDKRKDSSEVIEAYLPYSQKMFSVPSNLFIIGTMNTADRSVEALDTALRRRFSFKEVAPDPTLLNELEYQDVNLFKLLTKINQRIEVLIDRDHKIGHSYFFDIRNLADLKIVFKDKIIPLLEEYFYGDFGKIGLVLGENFIKGEDVKNTDVLANHSKYDKLEFLSDKILFKLNPIDDMSESDFVTIYE